MIGAWIRTLVADMNTSFFQDCNMRDKIFTLLELLCNFLWAGTKWLKGYVSLCSMPNHHPTLGNKSIWHCWPKAQSHASLASVRLMASHREGRHGSSCCRKGLALATLVRRRVAEFLEMNLMITPMCQPCSPFLCSLVPMWCHLSKALDSSPTIARRAFDMWPLI